MGCSSLFYRLSENCHSGLDPESNTYVNTYNYRFWDRRSWKRCWNKFRMTKNGTFAYRTTCKIVNYNPNIFNNLSKFGFRRFRTFYIFKSHGFGYAYPSERARAGNTLWRSVLVRPLKKILSTIVERCMRNRLFCFTDFTRSTS